MERVDVSDVIPIVRSKALLCIGVTANLRFLLPSAQSGSLVGMPEQFPFTLSCLRPRQVGEPDAPMSTPGRRSCGCGRRPGFLRGGSEARLPLLPDPARRIPYQFTAGYLALALLFGALSFTQSSREPADAG